MLSVKWRDEARADLFSILDFIAERNEAAALDLHARFERVLEHLPEHPFLYKQSLRALGSREIVAHPNYIIVYRVGVDFIEVLRILHARQQYP